MTIKTQPKIICIGWHKTGTTTMGAALLKLGYSVVGARLDLAESLLRGNVSNSILVAQEYNALQDVPWMAMYKELDKAYPNSKFILTVRDEDKWLYSAKKHFGKDYTAMREWLYGKGVLDGNEALYLDRYRKHYEDVYDYFKDRPDDLLIMDFKAGDGWEKLCGFLNCAVPQSNFPHSNKGKHNYNFYDKCLAFIRFNTPKRLRDLRVKLLIYLRGSDYRDKFNNKKYNKNKG
ncbi:sulfotransferase family protein [Mangrovimonas aestuarii]|uniref:sulfotransferase family protein n=1 Tax=Mangrovimonas aestuarii TaxID=3018443 RepID=UPI002377FB30|nr:sulfotransferase family protein [Mangrovimonas aestuarii]